MPQDSSSQPDKFILATLRDPSLRLRHTVWVDLIRDEAGFHAVPRGIPLQGVGPTPEEALAGMARVWGGPARGSQARLFMIVVWPPMIVDTFPCYSQESVHYEGATVIMAVRHSSRPGETGQ